MTLKTDRWYLIYHNNVELSAILRNIYKEGV